MAGAPAVQSRRVLDDLAELARTTGDGDGAHRVAWTPGWQRGRDLLRAGLAAIGLAAIEDEAGNLWGKLPGRRAEMLVLGSHLDSVPEGGPLDGALGVLAGLEVLRALIEANVFLEVTVGVVDWADEEGARFGRSLFGSSAAVGAVDVDAVRLQRRVGSGEQRVVADVHRRRAGMGRSPGEAEDEARRQRRAQRRPAQLRCGRAGADALQGDRRGSQPGRRARL